MYFVCYCFFKYEVLKTFKKFQKQYIGIFGLKHAPSIMLL